MILLRIQISTLFFIIASTLPLFAQNESLKSIEFYASSSNGSKLKPPVISLQGSDYLVLEFDDLENSYKQFHVKLVYCDYNWQPSNLPVLSYLSEFNDFIINQYANSQSTKVPYIHYGFRVPQVKLSGNYFLELYDGGIYGEPLLSLPFRVYEDHVGIKASVIRPSDPSKSKTHQEIDFLFFYKDYDVRNPKTEFVVEIRQNYNENRKIKNLVPSGVNLSKEEVYFRFFNNENTFLAGNEYRSLDVRSTFAGGMNVAAIQSGYQDRVQVLPQINRAKQVYARTADLNGRSAISTLDDMEAEITGDYLLAEFTYEDATLPATEEVYFLGAFNGFKKNEKSRCNKEEPGMWQCASLLKQGIHDFTLETASGRPDLEGNFWQTQNTYEIFVYHKGPWARTERLVGYALLEGE